MDPQQPPVPRRPAQQPPQHVAPPLVGGHDAVAYHEGGGTDVIGDHPQGHVLLLVLSVGHPRDFADVLHDVLDGVHLKEVAHPLHDAGQPLQAHAGVDVGMLQRLVMASPVTVELGEHQVPELHVPVAVAAHAAGRGAAAVRLSPVKIQLGAGAAGAGAVLPEVILLAQADDAIRRHSHFLRPDIEGLIVVLVDAHPDPILRQLQHLGDELPGPGRGLVLEIVAEAEVAQHLKIGAVAGGLAHPLDVGGADALLAGGHPLAGGRHLAGEELLHGRHARVDEQQGFVLLRYQREAGQPQMPLAFIKG